MEIIWRDRKRPFLGLPWSFTIYTLTEEKLLVKTGILRQKEEEVRLYRIMDVTLKRSLGERIFGVGTIHCCSADKSTPEFDILHVKDSQRVKNLISDLIEKQREIWACAASMSTSPSASAAASSWTATTS